MAAVAKLKKMFHAKPTKYRERREVNRMSLNYDVTYIEQLANMVR